jgi:glycine oxidase
MKVAIVGGGIIGCLTAWMLKRQGAMPVIFERGRIGRESSWAGAGILCPIHPWLYPDSFSSLVQASLEMYPAVQRELSEVSGIPVEWVRTGLLIPFFPGDCSGHREPALAWSRRFGWKVESLSADEARREEPALAANVESALLWPEVAQIRNPRLMKALRKALELSCIEIRENTEVSGIVEKAGRIRGVQLASGEQVRVDGVLLAAGSWSGVIARQWGFKLPVDPVKGQIILLKGGQGSLRHIVKHDDAYFVPRMDGRILVGASMEDAGFRRGNTVSVMHSLLDALLRLMPGLGEKEIERQWMGFRPGSPDGLPFLGPVPSRPGLWVASGHYRNGVLLAPVTARILSRWILGEKPTLDMNAFRADRLIKASVALGYPREGNRTASQLSAVRKE